MAASFAALARMSEAICGNRRRPGYRFAHPGSPPTAYGDHRVSVILDRYGGWSGSKP
jgi:hypothetical protein